MECTWTARGAQRVCQLAYGDGLHVRKVFIDEFGLSVWTSRSKRRAPRGQRAVRVVEGQRGKNVTVCLAISPLLGLVHSTIMEGGMNRGVVLRLHHGAGRTVDVQWRPICLVLRQRFISSEGAKFWWPRPTEVLTEVCTLLERLWDGWFLSQCFGQTTTFRSSNSAGNLRQTSTAKWNFALKKNTDCATGNRKQSSCHHDSKVYAVFQPCCGLHASMHPTRTYIYTWMTSHCMSDQLEFTLTKLILLF